MSKIGSSQVDPDSLRDAAVRLVERLLEPGCAESWLADLGAAPSADAADALRSLGELGLPSDLLATLFWRIAQFAHSKSDRQIAPPSSLSSALPRLLRYFEQVRSPLALATLFERDPDALPILLRVFSVGGRLADIILADVESFDLLRVVQGKSVSRDALLADLLREIEATGGERAAGHALRRVHDREVLRIGYGLLSCAANARRAGEDLAQLAEVLCEAALEVAQRRTTRGHDAAADRKWLLLALGDCGARLMHFDAPLKLLFLDDAFPNGAAKDASAAREDEADRIAKTVVSLLSSGDAPPYSVDLAFRIEPESPRLVAPLRRAVQRLDKFGRTWQRLEMLSARVVAGSPELEASLLSQLTPWLYRRRLTDADIDGLLFQYRKWRRLASESGLDALLRGVRILQLMLGGEHPDVRGAHLLDALKPLAAAGAWKPAQADELAEHLLYLAQNRLLRQIGAPTSDDEAHRRADAAQRIIGAALTDLFGEAPSPSAASELVMDPLPTEQEIVAALAPYGFAQPLEAGKVLAELAQESSPFLSTRKCRHYLAKIAPALLSSLSRTTSPDHALSVLARVVDSLGAKGALWELFLANPPSMELCVRLCAYAPYLSHILIANPGFIDELVDSLQLARLPSLAAMESRLNDLCKGVELEQAIHEFKSALHLRIGVRDILGKEEISTTHQALGQTAEAILRRVVAEQIRDLTAKHGVPIAEPDGKECGYVLLASGKVGALEPNYHSEIDFALIYQADGATRPASRQMTSVSCAHFFGQAAQRSLRRLTSRGRLGQLFTVNSELRPLGVQGPLAVSMEALAPHYLEGERTWRELLWLCKARPVGGDAALAAQVQELLRAALSRASIRRAQVEEFRQFRREQAAGARPLNLKRAPGGTLHIELLAQFLQLAYAERFPRILTPGTLDALARLQREGLLSASEASLLSGHYRFLRTLESRLRLMNTQARHDLPQQEPELRALAAFVGGGSPDVLQEECVSALRDVEAAIAAREVRLAKELPD